MFEGLRKPEELIVIVVTLLSYGCPVQAIVHALGLDERTVADWCNFWICIAARAVGILQRHKIALCTGLSYLYRVVYLRRYSSFKGDGRSQESFMFILPYLINRKERYEQ